MSPVVPQMSCPVSKAASQVQFHCCTSLTSFNLEYYLSHSLTWRLIHAWMPLRRTDQLFCRMFFSLPDDSFSLIEFWLCISIKNTTVSFSVHFIRRRKMSICSIIGDNHCPLAQVSSSEDIVELCKDSISQIFFLTNFSIYCRFLPETLFCWLPNDAFPFPLYLIYYSKKEIPLLFIHLFIY